MHTLKTYLLVFPLLILIMILSSCKDNPKTPPTQLNEPYLIIDCFGAWSPDGHTIAYFHPDTALLPLKAGLYIIDTNGTNKIQLTFEDLISGIDWSPDGNWIVFGSYTQIYKIKRNGDSLTPLTNQGSNFSPSWGPDGQWIVYESGSNDSVSDNGIWKIRNDRSQRIHIIDQGIMPSWSPSGIKIVHQRYFSNILPPELFTVDTSGNNLTRLTFDNDWFEEMPKYSPDGLMISYSATPASGIAYHLWVINSDGSNKHQISTHGYAPDWSPDGKMIIYTNTSTNSGRLWIMDKDGNNKKQVTL